MRFDRAIDKFSFQQIRWNNTFKKWPITLSWRQKTKFLKCQCLKIFWYIFARAGNLLICSLLICSLLICSSLIRSSLIRSFAHFAHFAQIKWASVSDLLRLLKTNERPWVNRSEEMSDVSESLRLLKTNEQPWVICSGRSEEMSKWGIRSKMFYIRFIKKKCSEKMSEALIFAHFLFFGEGCE